MCGIVGYIGEQEAQILLLDALKRLEYRGYDSAGISVIIEGKNSNSLVTEKSLGYIETLEKSLERNGSRIGICHTRWATHGVPSEINAHPHTDTLGKLAVVHNGIIDNHNDLRADLKKKGHEFRSQTDSEVIPHLIAEEYKGAKGDLIEAVRSAAGKLEGSFAIVVLHADHPDMIVSAREKSPMVLGQGVHEGFVASDVTALLKYTNRFLFMNDGEIACISRDSIKIQTFEGEEITREWMKVDWSLEDAEKGGFDHYMIKEIFEQPRSLHQTLTGWRSGKEDIPENIVNTGMIRIIACGTSYHASLLGKYLFERFTGIPTVVDMASEYRYANSTRDNSLVLLITQSGETADTIAAAREARRRGMRTMAITNVVGSTITRETDYSFYLRSGPEIGVAASKTFTSQLMMMYLISSHLGYMMGRIGYNEYKKIQEGLRLSIRAVESILNDTSSVEEMAEWFAKAENAFFLGRYVNYPVALEGSLKMKEISYIHCEGYPAGELKHGPLALLEERTPVVSIIASDHTYDKMLGNIGECSARSSPVLALAPEGDTEVEKYTDRILRYPEIDPLFSPIPISVVLQLLAYHAAKIRGCEIDKPRNLAKSVTVE
ncbi:MAG: glutamine--fructose-6-phosphate transaminase (isomerizing) [Thermoplasmatota archaeon]